MRRSDAGTVERRTYGDHPQHFGDLYVPERVITPAPVVLIHGGWWKAKTDLAQTAPLAEHLMSAGLVVWNIEFRRVGNGGGWPATFIDVSRAIDAVSDIATLQSLDASRTVLAGFSSGGHLALWAGHQRGTPTTRAALGLTEPTVTPLLVVSLAGLSDLSEAWRLDLGPMAVRNLLGGTPTEVPERYAAASPEPPESQRSRYLLVHGSADLNVPIEMSRDYVAKANRPGVTLVEIPGADHFALLDPTHPASRLAVAAAGLTPEPHAEGAHTSPQGLQ